MFLMTTDATRAKQVLDATTAALPIETGPIHDIAVGSHQLLWMRAQVRENLHVHPDGVLIGRRDASEPLSDAPIHHDRPLPQEFDPVLQGVVIRCGTGLTVEPLGVTNCFVAGTSVSDRQLLLAAEAGFLPGHSGVAILAGLGFFPGNLSLFDRVRRIPFLHRWLVESGRSERTRTLSAPKPDDDAMIERLVSLVPTEVPHALGMSGGYDSRFILGILHRAAADLRIVRFTDAETGIVEAVANELGLRVEGIGAYSDTDGQRSSADFTLMTDAQIWHGVAQYGRLRQHLSPSDWFHSGQFSDPMTKNTLKTAWKKPDPRVPFWDRLVTEGFLGNVPSIQPTLRGCATREELTRVVDEALQYQREYVEFSKRKQWANWMHYMNRGMRWSQAYYDDLTFSTNLTFLLSDIDAQLHGITSGFWSNFHNDRVASLNHRLLPEVSTGYSGGHPVTPVGGVQGALTKVEYEYLGRARTSRTARAKLKGIETTYEEALPDVEPSGYDALFDRPMREVAHQGRFGLRRANITVSNVLQFLATMPPPGRDQSRLRSGDQ